MNVTILKDCIIYNIHYFVYDIITYDRINFLKSQKPSIYTYIKIIIEREKRERWKNGANN